MLKEVTFTVCELSKGEKQYMWYMREERKSPGSANGQERAV